MSCSKAEHKIEYLKPSQLFRETMKRTYYSPSASFIALSFSDGFASLAISDECYLYALLSGIYPIDKTFPFDKLVDDVQSILELYDHELEGIIVTVHDSVAFLNVFDTLYREKMRSIKMGYKDKESVDKDEEMEDKDEEWEDSDRKTEYLKPLQLFRENMKRTYYMPSAVFLALSFRDEYCIPRDETLLDKLVEVVQSLKKDREWDLEGIIVSNNNSVAPPVNIHNLMEVLCKRGNIESLKYTYWKDDIKAGAFLNVFDTLHRGKDVFHTQHRDEDKEREDEARKKQCKMVF
ncbi:hypothetical protein EZV62_003680 [Acer yangbiense]|uniref:Uncharacterized protein n=1 Tax=Acer yangbiense TaxID=1000413 RepID=A0A5C7II39_9ROSI|nr:hypothetical protein EZV62_003680 [Acer yangbiense]